MPKAADRHAGKLLARKPARFPRRIKSDDQEQREMLKLWLYASLKMQQLAGSPDVGPSEKLPSPDRRRRPGT